MSSLPSLEELQASLRDIQGSSVAKRTHAAFLLRTEGSEQAVSIIADALQIREDSELMRHELAYIIGQMQHTSVCPVLEAILSDESDDLIVRHECAEALGALGNQPSMDLLLKFCTHPAPEIYETCKIAVELLEWKQRNEGGPTGDYLSVDPAPPVTTESSIEELQEKLMDGSSSMFNRYRAMFALRNRNTDASAMALGAGFADESALFRHEVAYVLGQMQRRCSADVLVSVLRNVCEHAMVRHEAAEALGAIGGQVGVGVRIPQNMSFNLSFLCLFIMIPYLEPTLSVFF